MVSERLCGRQSLNLAERATRLPHNVLHRTQHPRAPRRLHLRPRRGEHSLVTRPKGRPLKAPDALSKCLVTRNHPSLKVLDGEQGVGGMGLVQLFDFGKKLGEAADGIDDWPEFLGSSD